jgi:membrane protein required for colicin V production
MLLDVIAIALLVLAVYKGLRKGLIVALFSFIAFIVGLAAALKLSALAAGYIGDTISISEKWLPVIAFILVFLIVVLLIRLGARLIEKFVQVALMGWLNRLGGVFFYILIYFFIYSILLFYGAQLGIIKSETMEGSTAYQVIAPFAPGVIDTLAIVFPFIKGVFEQLLGFFQHLSDNHRSN